MGDAFLILLAIGLAIGFLMCLRLFGAWLFRIDEVIALLREIRQNTKAIGTKPDSQTRTPSPPDPDQQAFDEFRRERTG